VRVFEFSLVVHACVVRVLAVRGERVWCASCGV